jgi:cell wall-associated NlpC family hydrolase
MNQVGVAIRYAQFIHDKDTPYLWAGNNEWHGLDCSGLIVAIFRRMGIIKRNADLTAGGLYREYMKHETSTPHAGCLVFYGTNKQAITHVGFMISEYQIIEAGGGGSECKTIEISKEKGARVRMNHYQYRKPVAYVAVFAPDGSLKVPLSY